MVGNGFYKNTGLPNDFNCFRKFLFDCISNIEKAAFEFIYNMFFSWRYTTLWSDFEANLGTLDVSRLTTIFGNDDAIDDMEAMLSDVRRIIYEILKKRIVEVYVWNCRICRNRIR